MSRCLIRMTSLGQYKKKFEVRTALLIYTVRFQLMKILKASTFPKVVFNDSGHLLYMSRSKIPGLKNNGDQTPRLLQTGVYILILTRVS